MSRAVATVETRRARTHKVKSAEHTASSPINPTPDLSTAPADAVFAGNYTLIRQGNVIPREVVAWLQGLQLSFSVKNPRRDLANGYLIAEICARCWPDTVSMHCFENRLSVRNKESNWMVLRRVLQKKQVSVSEKMIAGMMASEPGYAEAFLRQLYTVMTGRTVAQYVPLACSLPVVKVNRYVPGKCKRHVVRMNDFSDEEEEDRGEGSNNNDNGHLDCGSKVGEIHDSINSYNKKDEAGNEKKHTCRSTSAPRSGGVCEGSVVSAAAVRRRLRGGTAAATRVPKPVRSAESTRHELKSLPSLSATTLNESMLNTIATTSKDKSNHKYEYEYDSDNCSSDEVVLAVSDKVSSNGCQALRVLETAVRSLPCTLPWSHACVREKVYLHSTLRADRQEARRCLSNRHGITQLGTDDTIGVYSDKRDTDDGSHIDAMSTDNMLHTVDDNVTTIEIKSDHDEKDEEDHAIVDADMSDDAEDELNRAEAPYLFHFIQFEHTFPVHVRRAVWCLLTKHTERVSEACMRSDGNTLSRLARLFLVRRVVRTTPLTDKLISDNALHHKAYAVPGTRKSSHHSSRVLRTPCCTHMNGPHNGTAAHADVNAKNSSSDTDKMGEDAVDETDSHSSSTNDVGEESNDEDISLGYREGAIRRTADGNHTPTSRRCFDFIAALLTRVAEQEPDVAFQLLCQSILERIALVRQTLRVLCHCTARWYAALCCAALSFHRPSAGRQLPVLLQTLYHIMVLEPYELCGRQSLLQQQEQPQDAVAADANADTVHDCMDHHENDCKRNSTDTMYNSGDYSSTGITNHTLVQTQSQINQVHRARTCSCTGLIDDATTQTSFLLLLRAMCYHVLHPPYTALPNVNTMSPTATTINLTRASITSNNISSNVHCHNAMTTNDNASTRTRTREKRNDSKDEDGVDAAMFAMAHRHVMTGLASESATRRLAAVALAVTLSQLGISHERLLSVGAVLLLASSVHTSRSMFTDDNYEDDLDKTREYINDTSDNNCCNEDGSAGDSVASFASRELPLFNALVATWLRSTLERCTAFRLVDLPRTTPLRWGNTSATYSSTPSPTKEAQQQQQPTAAAGMRRRAHTVVALTATVERVSQLEALCARGISHMVQYLSCAKKGGAEMMRMHALMVYEIARALLCVPILLTVSPDSLRDEDGSEERVTAAGQGDSVWQSEDGTPLRAEQSTVHLPAINTSVKNVSKHVNKNTNSNVGKQNKPSRNELNRSEWLTRSPSSCAVGAHFAGKEAWALKSRDLAGKMADVVVHFYANVASNELVAAALGSEYAILSITDKPELSVAQEAGVVRATRSLGALQGATGTDKEAAASEKQSSKEDTMDDVTKSKPSTSKTNVLETESATTAQYESAAAKRDTLKSTLPVAVVQDFLLGPFYTSHVMRYTSPLLLSEAVLLLYPSGLEGGARQTGRRIAARAAVLARERDMTAPLWQRIKWLYLINVPLDGDNNNDSSSSTSNNVENINESSTKDSKAMPIRGSQLEFDCIRMSNVRARTVKRTNTLYDDDGVRRNYATAGTVSLLDAATSVRSASTQQRWVEVLCRCYDDVVLVTTAVEMAQRLSARVCSEEKMRALRLVAAMAQRVVLQWYVEDVTGIRANEKALDSNNRSQMSLLRMSSSKPDSAGQARRVGNEAETKTVEERDEVPVLTRAMNWFMAHFNEMETRQA